METKQRFILVRNHLEGEGWVILFEKEVPDIQGPIHLSGEEDSWPSAAPT